jgi:predicted solute-binding protein
VRYGGVPYLNARPLLEGLAPLRLDVPSRLSARFLAGEFDAALLPVAAGALSGRPRIGSLGIVSDGRVDSVLLFLRRPPRSVRTLRLDPSSRTSRLLAQWILRAGHGARPEIVADEADADAELVIGDAALLRARGGEERLDLGEEWRRLTGLPFVFAAWYGDAAAVPALEAAYARGSLRIDDYAREASETLGLPAETLRTYLSERIRFRIGSAEAAGLDRFLEESRGAGLL